MAPNAFRAAITASLDAGRPVIAKVKSGEGRFRVITGYDGDALISPDYANAQRRPQGAPAYDELAALYLIGDKVQPRYTLKDGLERIVTVMTYKLLSATLFAQNSDNVGQIGWRAGEWREPRSGGSEGNRGATGDTEAPPELTKTADEVTIAPGENDTGKENASQSNQIFTEKTARGGAPQWSLDTITPILSSTTLKPSRFPARSLPFPTAAGIPTVAPPTH